MSLQFITGGSGSGKSTTLYHMISKEAAEHPEQKYIVLVPDQFTLETQKTLVELSGRGGILNVDVLSFHRLAYRAFEEVPVLQKTVLEDMGKMMLLRKVFGEQKENLKYFRRGLYKPGFLDECKSFLCELMQYAVTEDDFDKMEQVLGEESLMAMKMQDLRLIYYKLKEKMGDTYMMAEELISQLTSVISSISFIKNSVICLDGFTGFTPVQYELLGELLRLCDRMYVTVTTDRTGKRAPVFTISNDTMRKLSKLAIEGKVGVEPPIETGMGKEKIPYRLKESRELQFLEKYIFAYGTPEWKGEPEDIQIHICRKETEESAYVARSIWWLKKERGYSYDDFAVVTGDIAAYEQSLAKEMERLHIPYFMDYKKSIGANALSEYILSFMEMYRKGFDYESTFRFLRSGLSPLTTEETDILENYVLARGRRGFRSYSSQWESPVASVDLNLVNEYRRRFVDSVEEAVKALKGGRKTVEEFSCILYRLLLTNHCFDRIRQRSHEFEEEENPVMAREYRRIYRMMMELLDELVKLLGEEVVSFSEYEEILSAGISEGLIGFVPPAKGQVMIGDVERTRLKNVKVLFFMGVNDDRIPKRKGSPGLLSESERQRIADAGIELAPTPEEEAYREQFYLYLALTKPSEQLILTCSQMSGKGESKRPAYLMYKIRQLFPDISLKGEKNEEEDIPKILGTDKGMGYVITGLAEGTFGKDKAWWELAAYYERKQPGFLQRLLEIRESSKGKTKLSKMVAEKLYGDKIRGSITRLEQFARCPYAHFVLFGLGLKEREEYKVESYDYGNVFHGVMEHISHEMEKKQREWQDLTEEEIPVLAEEALDYVLSDYKDNMFHQSKRVEFVVTRMQRVMESALFAIWSQMKEGEFSQTWSEKRFPGPDNLQSMQIALEDQKSMILSGQIDRVDTCDKEGSHLVKILDYKSGSQDLSLDKVYYGLQLQLVAYMTAAMELEQKEHPEETVVPAAMLYYQMKEPELEYQAESKEERTRRMLKEMRCTGYANNAPEVLEAVDKNLAKDGAVIPGASSRIVPVSVTKKSGEFSAYSHILSTEQFQRLMQHATDKMKEFGNRIYEGEIQASPYEMAKGSGCDYCKLRGICGMEKKEFAANKRECPPMKDEEVWEVLNG